MKKISTYFLFTTLTILSTNLIQAQQLKCIICPEQLGISTVENGASIQALAPVEAITSKKSESTATKEDDTVLGFAMSQELQADIASPNNLIPTSDDDLCGDPTECGLMTEEEMEMAEKTFKIYPNPAHHWVVVNKEELGSGDYKIFIKDAQGNAVSELNMTTNAKTINLKTFEKGTYFITLRDEATYTKWVQKVQVQ